MQNGIFSSTQTFGLEKFHPAQTERGKFYSRNLSPKFLLSGTIMVFPQQKSNNCELILFFRDEKILKSKDFSLMYSRLKGLAVLIKYM